MDRSPDILLVTLNATYQHASFGLRYLYANLAELKDRAKIEEFTIAQKPRDIVETIIAQRPQIVGFGIYIWNTSQTYEVVSLLKTVAPNIKIVLGGPEVSYEIERQPLTTACDFVVQGEADLAFTDLCRAILRDGGAGIPKVQRAPLPPLAALKLPYDEYTEEDLRNRILYVEASRGCPYKCEFCLSSLDTSVRNFNLPSFLSAMDRLIERGARQFKFVDRTFNLSPAISTAILDFFLERLSKGLFLHFELVPDRLPDALKERIAKFPESSLQFEIGVQTWSPAVAANISRRQNYDKVRENFKYLVTKTNVHIHADLIVGLPGETLESFAAGFDALSELAPHEIQVGILKRLKGTPIIRHDDAFQMKYQSAPPFTVIQTKDMPFETVLKMERFAKFYDLFVNNGHFPSTIQWLKRAGQHRDRSWFWTFWNFSEFLNVRHPQRHSIALVNLAESLWKYLTEVLGVAADEARPALIYDFCERTKRDIPYFLKTSDAPVSRRQAARALVAARQQRFLTEMRKEKAL